MATYWILILKFHIVLSPADKDVNVDLHTNKNGDDVLWFIPICHFYDMGSAF